jgi:hypothetical protein
VPIILGGEIVIFEIEYDRYSGKFGIEGIGPKSEKTDMVPVNLGLSHNNQRENLLFPAKAGNTIVCLYYWGPIGESIVREVYLCDTVKEIGTIAGMIKRELR